MKVCFFGIYDKRYSRNRVLISGFQENGFEVVECNIDPRKYGGLKKFFQLYCEYKKIKHHNFDRIIVAFPGHSIMWFARILFGNRVVFDALVSLYNSEIEGRKLHLKYSFHAAYYWILDFLSCISARHILLDTNTHIDYFSKKYHIRKDKFVRIFIGTKSQDFYPLKKNNKNKKVFSVHFHGHFTPLHGVEYIIEASRILSIHTDIKFRIIGDGMGEKDFIKKVSRYGLSNIQFSRSVSYGDLNKYMNEADVCLGIFGDTIKARMVIPNKVYEALASGRAVITQDSPAIRELLSDRENVLLCKGANAKDLAEKILRLKEDNELRLVISKNGYRIFYSTLQPKMLVHGLLNMTK